MSSRRCRVSSLIILSLSTSLYGAGVQSADLNTIDLESNPVVVTNVSLEGLATSEDITNSISTNNSSFVDAVTNTPIHVESSGSGTDGEFPIIDWSKYGTIGALLAALVASVVWLRSKASQTDTALAQKANATDLPYRLVEPGVAYELSAATSPITYYDGEAYVAVDTVVEPIESGGGVTGYMLKVNVEGGSNIAEYTVDGTFVQWWSSGWTVGDGETIEPQIVLTGHLLDRAVNAVSVTGATTLTLPALENVGKARDFLVYATISNSAVPTFVANGQEHVQFLTEDGTFPEPDSDGLWSYSFTEMSQSVFAVSLIKLVIVDDGSSSDSSPDGV